MVTKHVLKYQNQETSLNMYFISLNLSVNNKKIAGQNFFKINSLIFLDTVFLVFLWKSIFRAFEWAPDNLNLTYRLWEAILQKTRNLKTTKSTTKVKIVAIQAQKETTRPLLKFSLLRSFEWMVGYYHEESSCRNINPTNLNVWRPCSFRPNERNSFRYVHWLIVSVRLSRKILVQQLRLSS